jgi:hypothetical protein
MLQAAQTQLEQTKVDAEQLSSLQGALSAAEAKLSAAEAKATTDALAGEAELETFKAGDHQ